MKTFSERARQIVAKIPKGATLTYAEVARRAGSPYAYRAVGNVLKGNNNPGIPCHRVICSDGAIGGYNRGVKRKRELLRGEGAIK